MKTKKKKRKKRKYRKRWTIIEEQVPVTSKSPSLKPRKTSDASESTIRQQKIMRHVPKGARFAVVKSSKKAEAVASSPSSHSVPSREVANEQQSDKEWLEWYNEQAKKLIKEKRFHSKVRLMTPQSYKINYNQRLKTRNAWAKMLRDKNTGKESWLKTCFGGSKKSQEG